MNIDIAGMILNGLLVGIGGLFVALWEALLQQPWIALVLISVVVLGLLEGRSRRRRRQYRY